MTSGTEAADSACKIARRWGIKEKGIPTQECVVLGVGSSYHGLASGVWGLMDPSRSRASKLIILPTYYPCYTLKIGWKRLRP